MWPAEPAILIVEDDPATAEVLQDVLEAAGYRVYMAADGGAALGRLADGGIDLLVVDQMLPVVHGRELCRRLRDAPSETYLPIIMLTALGGESYRRAALAAGADVYLTKPLDLDELLYVVDRWAQACARARIAGAGPAGSD
jgi:DNA-binding response OmpR family regulator